MASTLFRPDYVLFVLGIVWSVLAYNVHRPIRPTVTIGTVAFFLGWLFGELAAHHAILQILALGWLVVAGALDHPLGWVGAALTVSATAALLRYHEDGHRAGIGGVRALADAGIDPAPHEDRVGASAIARPFTFAGRDVRVERSIEIGRVGDHVLHADVHHRADRPANAPVLVYVHGGGWTIGYRRYQGLPILNALARAGWVCVSVSYRLSPSATFPDHIHDVLRGVAWAKANAPKWGGDPSFVAIVGNSAGAHLSALAALGHDEARLRPEELGDADLSVGACVGLYGVYDFTNRHGHWPGVGLLPFAEKVVMKATLAGDPEKFRLASPVDLVREDAPPFLLIHGEKDTLAPVEESRRLADALRSVSRAPVLYSEMKGAQHAFEIFHSVRGRYAVRTIVAFLEERARRSRVEIKSEQPLAEAVNA